MPSNAIVLQPGERLTVVAINPDLRPTHPIAPGGGGYWGQANDPGYGIEVGGPVDPGYSPPWARPRPPVDPGYSPPWAQVPGGGTGPVDPGYSPPWAQVPPQPTHPIVLPPTEPPPTTPPASDSGNWVWTWSPQAGRWVWVKVPGQGEAGPKAA